MFFEYTGMVTSRFLWHAAKQKKTQEEAGNFVKENHLSLDNGHSFHINPVSLHKFTYNISDLSEDIPSLISDFPLRSPDKNLKITKLNSRNTLSHISLFHIYMWIDD